LSKSECQQLAKTITGMAQGGGRLSLVIESQWNGELRWARNRVSLASDRRTFTAQLSRRLAQDIVGRASVNQVDEPSLRAMVRAAEQMARETGPIAQGDPFPYEPPPHLDGYVTPNAWSNATFGLDAESRGKIVRAMVEPVDQARMVAAGYLRVQGNAVANFESPVSSSANASVAHAAFIYRSSTAAQCSLTVRDPDGVGSGWAGLSSYDWARIDPSALGARALQKCLSSRNPVAIEPGRYTVVLEPQAVHDIVRFVAEWLPNRLGAENGYGPFAAGTPEHPHESLLGQKIAGDDVTIEYDPTDPDLVEALPGTWPGARPVTWVDHGILRSLGYDRRFYALPFLNQNLDSGGGRRAYRMAPGHATLDEMVADTRRGVLVTRFSNVTLLNPKVLLLTGLTRDGLWLIEKGKVSKPVKNFRFTESPLFMLNNVEVVGAPSVPVFSPGAPAVVPPLKARDFSFTSLTDAI
jgi:predicted Zn-dependent protease